MTTEALREDAEQLAHEMKCCVIDCANGWAWSKNNAEKIIEQAILAAFNAGCEKMREEAARYADKRCDRNFGNEIRNLPRPTYGEEK